MTSSLYRTPATVVWVALVAATCLSWGLGAGHGGGREAATVLVLALAFVKVHFVGAYFMELHDAPRVFGLIFDGWCAAVCALLTAMYLFG